MEQEQMQQAPQGQGGYSIGSAFVDIFAAPGRALDGIKGHNGWLWAPLTVMILASIGAFAYYFTWVDFAWYKDFLVEQAVAQGQPRGQVEEGMASLSPTMLIAITSAAIIFMTFLFYSIQAGYFHMVNKLTGGDDRSFGDWFAMTTWVTFFTVLNLVATFAVILTAENNQLAPTELIPLSLNSLFFNYTMDDGFAFGLTSNITILHIWLLYLMALGFSKFSGRSMGKGFAVATPIWAVLGLLAGVFGG